MSVKLTVSALVPVQYEGVKNALSLLGAGMVLLQLKQKAGTLVSLNTSSFPRLVDPLT